MTVSAQTPINRSTGNGVTTVFPYTFKIISSADMEVSVDGVVKTLTVDYTLSGVGDDAGGNVTMLAAPATSTSVVRRRNMALTRNTDYQDQGELPASTLDSDLDSAVLMIQQVDEKTDRAMVLPTYVSGFSTELPTPIANYFMRVNSAGTALELASEITPGALTVTPFIETLLNDSTKADARTTLGAAASGANTDITSITGNAATATNVTGTIASATTATTQSVGDNSTKVATTAFVRSVGPSYGGITGFSANTTLTSANYGNFIYVNGTFTLTLPVADAANIGRTITCYGYAAASVTVATQSSQTLYYQGTNTATSAVMVGIGDTVTFVNYSGTAWMAIGSNSIGGGQAYSNVTGGRVLGTTYTNTTGKPIFAIVCITFGGGAGVYNFNVAGSAVAAITGSQANGALPTIGGVIPTGATYSVSLASGNAGTLTSWTELR